MSTPSTATGPATETGTFTLLLFASAQSYTSASSLTLPAPMTLLQLYTHLETHYPGIGEKILKSSQVVQNLEYVDCEWEERESKGGDVVFKAGDEAGIVPPVSAG